MTRVAQSIEVNVPVRIAYNQWTQFEEFPRFMEGIQEVRQLDPAHLHWRASRNGVAVEWDSEITDQVPDRYIAWRDTSGPNNSGSIEFEPMQSDKTWVQMTIECDPAGAWSEGGQAAQAVSQRVEQDLARFKKLLESRGRESGAWRDEIRDSPPVRPQMPQASDATDSPMQKTVGQTEAERQDAGQSGANASRDFGTASKSAGPQWLPNLLQGWEEPRVMVKKMSEEMDQLFERFIGRPMASRFGQTGASGKWMPPVEVVQRDNQLIICTDLPGVKIEDVQIEIDQDRLTIEGDRPEPRHQAQVPGYRRSERCYGRFHRMIPLPAGADADSAQASMCDGVLEITMPMPASTERRGRRIDIQPPH
ncbi:MAG: hypothetical protein A3I66_22325 [Burkholderiales bacterium RIFCSPLOWO2_02_FULL_57_36]|nr:MAG: hypothetical protein A3I66_22325 [Burkholderiales bacterium RIFCSPLOWO2_02_FULL_57_36]